jgi:hypothetical protein
VNWAAFIQESLGWFDGLIWTLFLFHVVFLVPNRPWVPMDPELRRRLSEVIIELFPVLGILGTVWGLFWTLQTIGKTMAADAVNIGQVAQQFGGALTSTFSGLLAIGISLVIMAIRGED